MYKKNVVFSKFYNKELLKNLFMELVKVCKRTVILVILLYLLKSILNFFNINCDIFFGKINIVLFLIIMNIALLYRAFSNDVSNYFDKLLNELENRLIDSESLKKIIENFHLALKDVDDVNTQVIIEKDLYLGNEKLKEKELKLEYMTNLVIILGLLGTFIGLTMAIINIGNSLQIGTAKDSGDAVDQFLKQLIPAISGMGTAFISSIVGLVTSILMNWFGNGYRIKKQNLIDCLEDYLDNQEAKSKEKKMVSKFDKIVTAIEDMKKSIDKSSAEMSRFNSNMKKNSDSLIKASERFERVVDKFEEPLCNFRESIDKFIDVYDGMDKKAKQLDNIINKNFARVVDNFVQAFEKNTEKYEENTNRQIEFMEGSNEIQKDIEKRMDLMINEIITTSEKLQETYNDLNNMINNIQEKAISEQNSLKRVENELIDMLKHFESEIKNLGDFIAQKTSDSISESMSNISKETSKNMILASEESNKILLKGVKKVISDFDDMYDSSVNNMESVMETMEKTMESNMKTMEGNMKTMEDNLKTMKENLKTMLETIQSIYTQVNKLQEENLGKE